MDDESWAGESVSTSSRQQTPIQHSNKPPLVITGFAAGHGSSQRTPTQEAGAWGPQLTEKHAAEMRKKDEAFENLRMISEQEKATLQAEIAKLKAEIESTGAHGTSEKAVLHEQIETMKLTADQAKMNAETAAKDLGMTIERLKEDVEGREHNIEERNAVIAERDIVIADLRHELEAEKSKEPEKIPPVPTNLIPDLDPWYGGSLERYIAMLRSEANEPQVENKISTFRAFLKAESAIRGIEFYDAPPPAPATLVETTTMEPLEGSLKASNMSKPAVSRGDLMIQVPEPQDSPEEEYNYSPGGRPLLKRQASIMMEPPESFLHASNVSKPAVTRGDLIVQVPEPQDLPEEDYDYSPGGRPLLKRQATIPINETANVQRPAGPSAPSTTVLTPTSSVDDDLNKTPVQSPPDEQPQPVYKAYAPPALFSNPSASSVHRQSISDSFAPAPLVSHAAQPFEHRASLSTGTNQHHDEIFFGTQKPGASTEASSPNSSDSATPDVSRPAPLAFASHRSVSTAPPSMEDPSELLIDLLPVTITPATSNHMVEEVEKKFAHLKNNTSSIDELTTKWDKDATVTRKKNDSARRKRQEDNEETNDDAFNNEEISYADLNVLEEEFKQKENILKAQEDRDEYASYVEAVFDPIYDALQSEIKGLMDLYVESESLLHTSVSGVQSLERDALSTLSTLELLQDVHNAILDRQDRVVGAVAERDKRYKKTEIQPLYASGNMAKMKAVEKHFENAEKQANLRALRDKATRVGELVSVVEDVVVNAVGVEQREIDHIIAALRDLDDGTADADLVSRAHSTLTHLKSSSKSLLSLFNNMEIRHNAAVLDAEIAQARIEGKDLKSLEEQKDKGEKGFMEEFQRRVDVIEQDSEEVEELIKKKRRVESEEQEREKRLKAALEEAKRRNGDA
jgi:hypothetical protein